MLEKCRGNMQIQFEQWYSNLHSRQGLIGQGQDSGPGSARGDPSTGMPVGPAGSPMDASPLQQQPPRRGPPAPLPAAPPIQASLGPLSARGEASAKHGGAASATSVPRGAGKDRKEEDDSDVNEDIMAFYLAKEELLKRRAR